MRQRELSSASSSQRRACGEGDALPSRDAPRIETPPRRAIATVPAEERPRALHSGMEPRTTSSAVLLSSFLTRIRISPILPILTG